MEIVENQRFFKHKMHPNSLKNLKPYPKGVSGHPGRTPKDVSLTSLLKRYLEEVPELKIGGKPNTKTWRELLTQAWLVAAYKGNPTQFKELLERVNGKVTQPIGGEGGGPIGVEIDAKGKLANLIASIVARIGEA